MLDTLLTSSLDSLSPRFLQVDSADLLTDRLDGSQVSALVRWYVDPRGGRSGLCLLERAPVLDVWVGAIAPPVLPAARNESVVGAIAWVAGLISATFVVDQASELRPCAAQLDLDDALDVLESECVRAEVLSRLPLAQITSRYLAFFGRVAELNAGAQLQQEALFQLSELIARSTPQLQGRIGWSRLQFFAGLIAGGVGLPPRGTESAAAPLAGVREDD